MNKILCFILTFALLLTGAIVANAQVAYALGDVNGNGVIAADDALLVLQYSVDKANLTEAQVTAADTTGENDPSAKDALYILQKAVDMIRHFPAQITKVGYRQWELTHVDSHETLPMRPRNKNYIYAADDSETPRVALCKTLEELTAALAETYGVSSVGQASVAEQFAQDYFEQNALLLIEAVTPSTGTEVLLEGLYAVEGHLYVDLAYWGTYNGGQATEDRIYWIELTDVPAVETVTLETDWWTVDIYGNDHISKTVTETVPVL